MHGKGDGAKKKSLVVSLGALAAVSWAGPERATPRGMPLNLPSRWTLRVGVTIGGQPLVRLGLDADLSLIRIGAGAIIGNRVGTSPPWLARSSAGMAIPEDSRRHAERYSLVVAVGSITGGSLIAVFVAAADRLPGC